MVDLPVAVVTGATRGIGERTASHLAERGHPVSVCASTPGAAEAAARSLGERFGVPTHGATVDLTDSAAARAFVASTAHHLGGPTILVNNAGMLGPVGRLETCDLTAWRRCVDLDLTSVAIMTALCLPHMTSAGWGRVINLAGGGVGGPDAAVGVSAYVAAKAGVVALTEAVAREVEAPGIVVCAIAPGSIDTGFMGAVLAADPAHVPPGLVEMAERQRDRPDDLGPFLELLDHLLDSHVPELSGRMLSARWETPAALASLGDELAQMPSRFRLRRIDAALYTELTDR